MDPAQKTTDLAALRIKVGRWSKDCELLHRDHCPKASTYRSYSTGRMRPFCTTFMGNSPCSNGHVEPVRYTGLSAHARVRAFAAR
jgi:hypothetical protein